MVDDSHSQDAALQAASLTQAELPLGPALRAAASEAASRRTQRALVRLADAIDAGQPLAAALRAQGSALPAGIAPLLATGGAPTPLPAAIRDLVEFELETRDGLRTVAAALAYPLLLGLFTYGCFLLTLFTLVGELAQFLLEMEVDLAPSTRMFVDLYAWRWWLLAGPAVLAAAVVGGGWLIGPTRRDRVLAMLPLFGPLFHLFGAAQATRSLGHLVTRNVPLPEALDASADQLRDQSLAAVWRELSAHVAAGEPFSAALLTSRHVPYSIVPLIRWGEAHDALGESLRQASDMLAGRLRLRADTLRLVLPPALFITIALLVFVSAVALMLPLFQLIQYLSY